MFIAEAFMFCVYVWGKRRNLARVLVRLNAMFDIHCELLWSPWSSAARLMAATSAGDLKSV